MAAQLRRPPTTTRAIVPHLGGLCATKSSKPRSAVYMPRIIRSTEPGRCGWKCVEKAIDVARCTVERLMGVLGLEGARRGKAKRTTIADPQGRRADDLVQRKFNPVAPNVLWVADFTYVSTWSGWVYVAFVIDAYSRRILGWRTATTMATPLVLDAIEHAIWTRRREGITELAGLIHHNDRGSQGVFNRSSQHLPDRGVR